MIKYIVSIPLFFPLSKLRLLCFQITPKLKRATILEFYIHIIPVKNSKLIPLCFVDF